MFPLFQDYEVLSSRQMRSFLELRRHDRNEAAKLFPENNRMYYYQKLDKKMVEECLTKEGFTVNSIKVLEAILGT